MASLRALGSSACPRALLALAGCLGPCGGRWLAAPAARGRSASSSSSAPPPPPKEEKGGLHIEWGVGFGGDGPVTPVTLLAGFLGAGKTTLLKRLLENRSGTRVGVLVNDVAAVNVDANLVMSQVAGAEGVEVAQLQNGCVCCSISDDLFASISNLMERSPEEGFDHLLVELSGVSEPSAVKQNWVTAIEVGHPAALRTQIRRVVTVVDASVFGKDWASAKSAVPRNGLDGLVADNLSRPVVELLSEQVETADIILLNKADLADPEELASARGIVAGLNSRATVLVSEYGGVDPTALLPAPKSAAADAANGHGHAAGHGHGAHGGCDGHGHDAHGGCDGHGHDAHGGCEGHGHDAHGACEETVHVHLGGEDQGHGHAHSHASSPQTRYGISSFVYRARRPFDTDRWNAFVEALKSDRRSAVDGKLGPPELALSGLLRAKGTCWLSSQPLHEHSWSFAGADATLRSVNPWWSALSGQHLMWRAAYPGMQAIYERVRDECWDKEGPWGDRRQELVFIGGPGMTEEEMTARLNACLLSDKEMEAFTEEYTGKMAPFEMNFDGVSISMG